MGAKELQLVWGELHWRAGMGYRVAEIDKARVRPVKKPALYPASLHSCP